MRLSDCRRGCLHPYPPLVLTGFFPLGMRQVREKLVEVLPNAEVWMRRQLPWHILLLLSHLVLPGCAQKRSVLLPELPPDSQAIPKGQASSKIDSSPYGLAKIPPLETPAEPEPPRSSDNAKDKKPSVTLTAAREEPKQPSPLDNPPVLPLAVSGRPILPALQEEKREPLVEALDAILKNRHEEALQHLKVYDVETQDIFIRLLPPLTVLTRKKYADLNAEEIGLLHEQLHRLLTTLRPRLELSLGKVCFCEWVKAYGIYKPLPEDHLFQAQHSQRPGDLVQLYVELNNFCSEPRDGYFETVFSSVLEIRDARGQLVRSFPFEDRKHPLRSRAPLHDYFKNYSFYVPDLPAGTYTLIVQITDETNPSRPRQARKAVPFRITGVR